MPYFTNRGITPLPVGGGGAFTPLDLPGLVAWYDASVYASLTKQGGGSPSNGNEIATWADQSGNGYTLNGTLFQTPEYQSAGFNSAYPTLTWRGNDNQGLVTATSVTHFSGGTAGSIFIVCNINSAIHSTGGRFATFSTTGSAHDAGANDAMFLYNNAGVLSSWSNGALGSVAYSTGVNYRIGASFDSTDSDIYLNNVQSDSTGGSATFGATGSICVGARQLVNVSTDVSFGGVISEIIIGNVVWTPAQFASLYTYAGTKWGL